MAHNHVVSSWITRILSILKWGEGGEIGRDGGEEGERERWGGGGGE